MVKAAWMPGTVKEQGRLYGHVAQLLVSLQPGSLSTGVWGCGRGCGWHGMVRERPFHYLGGGLEDFLKK